MASIESENYLRLEQVRKCERTARGVRLHVDDEQFRVDVLRTDLFRLKISRGGRFDEQPTFAACFDEATAAPPFTVDESPDEVVVTTERMRLVVKKAPFTFHAYRSDGSIIFESASGSEGPEAYRFLNNAFIVGRKHELADSYFGLGEKTGASNRRGRSFVMWNNDVASWQTLALNHLDHPDRKDFLGTSFDPYYVNIPFYYHCRPSAGTSRCAGFFIDNGYRANVDFTRSDRAELQFLGGQYTEYVFAGPAIQDILEAYTWVTGRAGLPPLWSLGFHQCRWHDYRQEEVLELARSYREKAISCDVLWLDIGYMDGYRVFTWDKEKFPEPKKLLGQLREQGFRCVTIVDPGVKLEPGYSVYDEGIGQNLFCKTEEGTPFVGMVWPGRTVFPDFVKPEARAFWGRLNAEHVESGLAGIWNDMNEPATGPGISPYDMRFDRDGANFSHDRYHNQYAFLMAMGTHEGLLKARPDERPFILSRAGFAGIQRVAANWMGDNASRWEHLSMSLPMAHGLGLCGQPFVGADIPGFFERPTAELMVRWIEYGALTPFARAHNCAGHLDQYPWSFGASVEELCRQAISLRYRLLPYLYTSFVHAAETGEPVQRPLVFDFQHDRTAQETDDEYLLGRSLLVAPVLEPKVTARHVYLPKGTWVDWYTKEAYRGPAYVTLPAPIERIPLLVRGGHVVPTLVEAPPSTLGHRPRELELLVALPLEDGTFESELQEDDGLSNAALRGAHLRTRFRLERRGVEVKLVASSSGQGYPEHERERLTIRLLNGAPVSALLDGRAVAVSAGALTFDDRGQGFTLEFEVSPGTA